MNDKQTTIQDNGKKKWSTPTCENLEELKIEGGTNTMIAEVSFGAGS